MTEREKQLEERLTSLMKSVEAMKPFMCGSLTCRNRVDAKVCPNCGNIVL